VEAPNLTRTISALAAFCLACTPAKRPAPTAAAPSNTVAAESPLGSAVARTPSARPETSAPTARQGCGMPASLVARGWPTELTPTSTVEAPLFVPGATTLVVLPDTQYYADCESRHLSDQTRWVAEQAKSRNVRGVLTLGDLTDKNSEREWRYVKSGVGLVENAAPVVLVTGNHDLGDRGTANRRQSLLQKFFPDPPGQAKQALAATARPGDIENAYYRIALPRVTLGVLSLEWSPRSASVAWANDVLGRYAQDRVIVLTHAYLYEDGSRYDWWKKGAKQEWNPLAYGTGQKDTREPTTRANLNAEGALDGEMLWNDLVKRHRGIFLVVSGHVLGRGAALLESRGEAGNAVLQVLVNFQMLKDGGLGYLRLLELLPDGKTLRQKTYSPTLGVFATGPEQSGELVIDPPLW
jgi:hypothetical protein